MKTVYLKEIKRLLKLYYGIRIPVNNILSVVHHSKRTHINKPGTILSDVHIINHNNVIIRHSIVHKFNRAPEDSEILYLNDNYAVDEVYNNILTNAEIRAILKYDEFIVDDDLSIYHMSNLKNNYTTNNLNIIDNL